MRELAISLFGAIAQLSPAATTAHTNSDGHNNSAATTTLFGCFAQHGVMRALARPLHDGTELVSIRRRTVALMADLAATEHGATLTAMARADVFPALVRLAGPVHVANSRQKVDLGARAIFERIARHGIAPVLTLLHARPSLGEFLGEFVVYMPEPPSLAKLGGAARAALADEVLGPDLDEITLLIHAASCVRASHGNSGGLDQGERGAARAILAFACRTAERAVRTLRAYAERRVAMSKLDRGTWSDRSELPTHQRLSAAHAADASASYRASLGLISACISADLGAEIAISGVCAWLLDTGLPQQQRAPQQQRMFEGREELDAYLEPAQVVVVVLAAVVVVVAVWLVVVVVW